MADPIVKLNVGGIKTSTHQSVLIQHENSRLVDWFRDVGSCPLPKDDDGAFFIDRDGGHFRLILDYLRLGHITLPEGFDQRAMLKNEADYYGLSGLAAELSSTTPGYITLGYQGSFSFGRQGVAATDVNFRKISRILVCGKVGLCREVFGDSLNEGRDPDRGEDQRYSARFFLKHSSLEQAFDALAAANFRLNGSCASGTSSGQTEKNPGATTSEEDRWAHYNEFVFARA